MKTLVIIFVFIYIFRSNLWAGQADPGRVFPIGDSLSAPAVGEPMLRTPMTLEKYQNLNCNLSNHYAECQYWNNRSATMLNNLSDFKISKVGDQAGTLDFYMTSFVNSFTDGFGRNNRNSLMLYVKRSDILNTNFKTFALSITGWDFIKKKFTNLTNRAGASVTTGSCISGNLNETCIFVGKISNPKNLDTIDYSIYVIRQSAITSAIANYPPENIGVIPALKAEKSITLSFPNAPAAVTDSTHHRFNPDIDAMAIDPITQNLILVTSDRTCESYLTYSSFIQCQNTFQAGIRVFSVTRQNLLTSTRGQPVPVNFRGVLKRTDFPSSDAEISNLSAGYFFDSSPIFIGMYGASGSGGITGLDINDQRKTLFAGYGNSGAGYLLLDQPIDTEQNVDFRITPNAPLFKSSIPSTAYEVGFKNSENGKKISDYPSGPDTGHGGYSVSFLPGANESRFVIASALLDDDMDPLGMRGSIMDAPTNIGFAYLICPGTRLQTQCWDWF